MNNFGVIEIATAKTTAAPGWAYVPDTGPINGGNQPANRKRARNAPGLSLGDLSARQEAKIRKEVEALDKDNGRDAAIPLPVKSGRGKSSKTPMTGVRQDADAYTFLAQAKHTPNVRKILQSQKTFTNHLDDFLALQALAEANTASANASKRQTTGNRKDSTPNASGSGAKQPAATTTSVGDDTPMTNANLEPVLPPPSEHPAPPPPHPADDNPLLQSRVPEPPSDEELRRLLAHPPLTYVEASGNYDGTYPARVFCEVCGYWGRVRCMKCGTRVCALDCLDTHKEDCVTRYGF
jgi:zinc finger HIT domain-containing protein 1